MELSFFSLPKKLINLAMLLMATISVDLCAQPSIEDYGALPTIQNMAISPNGDLIAYRTVLDGRDIVQVASLKEGRAISSLDVGSVRVSDVYFANNKQVIFRASENRRVPYHSRKADISVLYSLDIETGDFKQLLVPGDGGVYPSQIGLGDIIGISPDEKYAFMQAYFWKNAYVGFSPPSFSLLRVPLAGTGQPIRIKIANLETRGFFVDAVGEAIAMEEFDYSKKLHRIMSLQDGDWNEVFSEETPRAKKGFMGLTPDRKKLVVVDESSESDRMAYFELSLETGRLEGPIYERADVDVEAVITDIQRVVHGIKYSGFMPSYFFFDRELNTRVKRILAHFPDHAVTVVDFSPDWKHILVLVEGSQSSGEYYLFSEGSEPHFIAYQRPSIPPEYVNPIGKVTFSARDGLKIPTLITIPRDSVADMTDLPAVVMPHGGPAAYDEIGFDYWAQALASEGYMVIMPQFRGSSGFGLAHKAAGYGEWGGKMQDDISDAVGFFTDRGMINPERVCILGAGYGGFAALAGGAFTPDLYKCVVSINGIGDLERFQYLVSNSPVAFRASQALVYWENQIGAEKYTAEIARLRSPENSVERYTAPVLLIYSDEDMVVPSSQSEDMYDALDRADKEVQLLELEGDDHYLSFGETRTKALKATIDFVNTNIGM